MHRAGCYLKSRKLGADERTSEELRKLSASELLVTMTKYYFRILPSPHECHEELRRSTRPTEQLCKLDPTNAGMFAYGIKRSKKEKLITHSCTTYYGSSVLASQIWSLTHLFPQENRIWTVGDVVGRVGVVLGHAGMEPCFISDHHLVGSTRTRSTMVC